MDARVNVSSNQLDVCLYAANLTPSQYGLRVREGYRQWQTGLGEEVRSIIPFAGDAVDRTDDRLFAVTRLGIYDVTAEGGTPTNKLLFSDVTLDAGYGVYAHYVDQAGVDVLFYADARNGLFSYDKTLDTWAQATGITAAAGSINTFDVTEIYYIVVHKLRIWLVPRNATYAWYLPILSATGEAQEFFFGGKFKHGGELKGLYNWTVDGGDGIDDKLVAISQAGDVIPYQGDDPTLETWSSIGTYFIGTMPKGVRIASEYGGDLYILSTFGITSMRDLLQGAEIADPTAYGIGLKIARFLRDDLLTYGDRDGFSIRFVPDQGELIITVPRRNDGRWRQYAYNIVSQGWGFWRDVPAQTLEPWTGHVMIGDLDGSIYRMDVSKDNMTVDRTGGAAIKFTVLTAYTDLGAPGQFKRVQNIRPNFLSRQSLDYTARAYYDFNTALLNEPGAGTPPEGSLWDNSLWDQALWESGELIPFFELQGARGSGRTVAVYMNGSATEETFLASWDISWSQGGFL